MSEQRTIEPKLYFRRMAGLCANGFERDGGRLVHAIRSENEPGWCAALCGAKPGRRGNGWSEWNQEAATCPRCLKKLLGKPSTIPRETYQDIVDESYREHEWSFKW